MSVETRNTLMYGQLQEGLKIMESPAVSSAADYQNLYLAAKAEGKRLAELKKRRHYLSEQKHTSSPKSGGSKNRQPTNEQSDGGNGHKNSLIRCWNFQQTGDIAVDCKRGKSERPTKGGKTQQVQSSSSRHHYCWGGGVQSYRSCR